MSAGEPLSDRHEFSRAPLLLRIDQEFAAMPGLRLTLPQASRLFALTPDACARVLSELEHHGVLRRTTNGTYCRIDLGVQPPLQGS